MSTRRRSDGRGSIARAFAWLPWASLSVATAAGLLTACPGTISDPALFEDVMTTTSCTNAPTAIFTPTCAVTGCHTSADMAGSLDLQSPNVFQRLVGKSASGGPGILIDPAGDPSHSILYLKLTSDPPFGAEMPLTGNKLDATQLGCVGTWIMAEALTTDAGKKTDSGSATDSAPAEDVVPGDATDETVDPSEDASDTGTEGTDSGIHDAGSDAAAHGG